MNRRYLVLVLTSLLCCLLLFTVYPSIKLSDNFMIQYEPRGNKLKTFEKKGAFATVLCDVDMVNNKKDKALFAADTKYHMIYRLNLL